MTKIKVESWKSWKGITTILSTSIAVVSALAAVFFYISSTLSNIDSNTQHTQAEPERAAERQQIKETVIRIEERLKSNTKLEKKIRKLVTDLQLGR